MEIIIAGDFCPNKRVAEKIAEHNTSTIYSSVSSVISSADYSLVNFECPVVNSEFAKPIKKKGPNLKCAPEAIKLIKDFGFKGVTLANNHFRDYGNEGVMNTLEILQDANLDIVGGGDNLESSQAILYKKNEGNTVAFINACEHEFSYATNERAGSNPLNLVSQYYAIKDAREIAQFVIVIIHGGHELYQLPSPRMQETYRFFIDAGADVVINHHQHCYSGYEIYKGKPIFYGLGNFCFDKLSSSAPSIWNDGYMVKLIISEFEINFELLPYKQCAKVPGVFFMNGTDEETFYFNIKRFNSIISSKDRLKSEYDLWQKRIVQQYEDAFKPYNNKWLLAASHRRLFPEFISKSKLLSYYNYIICESHRDNMLAALDKFINSK